MKGHINHADRSHSVLSASGAERWMNCTPSARLSEKMPQQDSDYAKEGELAHEVAEITLLHRVGHRNDSDLSARMKVLRKSAHWYDGITEDVLPYVDFIHEQINSDKDSALHVEVKVDLSAFIEQGRGTCDSAVIAKDTLYITDLKFGRGVRVSAVDNSQLKLYAVGALQEFGMLYDITTVVLSIVQPRLDAVSTWAITVDDLLDWAENTVKPVAEIAFNGEGDHAPGDWCRFCRAKVICPALKAEALSAAELDFSADDVDKDSEDDLLQVYAVADRITDYLETVKAFVYQRALEGKRWPGLKLVAGKSSRRIADEWIALTLLIDEGYDRDQLINVKLKGIGELEKLLGDDFELLNGCIDKPTGKPTLVDESDKRQEINKAEDFN